MTCGFSAVPRLSIAEFNQPTGKPVEVNLEFARFAFYLSVPKSYHLFFYHPFTKNLRNYDTIIGFVAAALAHIR